MDVELASFPGHSHLQFLITCSMQKRRGKAWEKKSRAWRQVDMRVDIHVRGVVPDHCNSQTLHWSASNLPNNELYWRWRTPRFFVGHRPTRLPSRLPYIMDMTLSPRPPPSIFAYCKRSKTGGRNGLGKRLGPGLCSLAWLQICSYYTESKILVAVPKMVSEPKPKLILAYTHNHYTHAVNHAPQSKLSSTPSLAPMSTLTLTLYFLNAFWMICAACKSCSCSESADQQHTYT